MQAGPAAETRPLQKLIISFAFVSTWGDDRGERVGLSLRLVSVPAAVSVIGDVLVALGLGISMIMTIQNGYAAANIKVESGQKLVSTGLYGWSATRCTSETSC